MTRGPKKLMGPVAYYLDAEGTCTGKPTLRNTFGPFRTMQEAEMKKLEQDNAVGQPGYEYEYHIRPELVLPPRKKSK
jgi:hypothetical protein